MDHAAIVVELGGHRAVADALGLRPAVVWRWGRGRPIPPRRWAWIVARAQTMGVDGVTLEAVARCDESEASRVRRLREAELRARRRARGTGGGSGEPQAAA